MTNINQESQEKFLNLVRQKIGISVRKNDLDNFNKNLLTRMNSNKIYSSSKYYDLLTENSLKSHEEWEKLVVLLTNLESYFFRDKGQINILQNYILPNLIKENYHHKNLTIVSAGCSTGEEVYSLAILIEEMIKNINEWNIKIYGLDLNLEALDKARKGIYGNWSLRTMPQEKKDTYFIKKNDQYEVLPQYKKLVKFQYFNLIHDSWEKLTPPLNNVDLIICRNVFIYFEPNSISKVINKFTQILKQEGYLMTGHAEVNAKEMNQFNSKSFSESLIYIYNPNNKNISENPSNNVTNNEHLLETISMNFQNIFPTNNNLQPLNSLNIYNPVINNISVNIQQNNTIQSPSLPPLKIEEYSLFIETKKLIKNQSYGQAINNTKKLIEQYPKNLLPYQMMAEIYANTGDYPQAQKYCQEALKIDSFAVFPHYILSHIADDQGDLQETKRLLKKIIYLEPNFFPAYIELANIYKLENELSYAEKMFKNLLNIINKLPDNQVISDLDNLTVAQLKEKINTEILTISNIL
ncbi:CheR family methyltransferase [Geminocystis sp. GBBB08]|uniref:CheR family methyltransferase n=1 Tax=Geminocystis sp. GBBB08 TaxID=2604140 RepID=UPI0027E2DDF8|nr:CheR family methyltransferase [Geminocystis sp. GBBB08]MBL1209222.1 chemotaxis protein CheR [Geminocystis sp. GBBB08]